MLERLKIIGSGLMIITTKVWKFIAPSLRTFMKEYGPVLQAAAISAVQAAAVAYLGQPGKGADKQAMAFGDIAKTLEQEGYRIGVEVATREINKAIEMALDYVEAER